MSESVLRWSGPALKFPQRDTDWTAALNSTLGLAWSTRLFLDTVVQANTVEETGRLLSRLSMALPPGQRPLCLSPGVRWWSRIEYCGTPNQCETDLLV